MEGNGGNAYINYIRAMAVSIFPFSSGAVKIQLEVPNHILAFCFSIAWHSRIAMFYSYVSGLKKQFDSIALNITARWLSSSCTVDSGSNFQTEFLCFTSFFSAFFQIGHVFRVLSLLEGLPCCFSRFHLCKSRLRFLSPQQTLCLRMKHVAMMKRSLSWSVGSRQWGL